MKKIINVLFFYIKPLFILGLSNLFLQMVSIGIVFCLHYYDFENDLSPSFVNYMLFIFYVLIFNSIVMTFNTEDRYVQSKFIEKLKNEKRKKFSPFRFVLTTPFFYIEALLLAITAIVFRSTFSFHSVSKMFFEDTPPLSDEAKIKSVLIVVLVMFIIDFIAHYIVVKNWLRGINGVLEDLKEERISISFYILKRLGIVALIYVLGTDAIVVLLPAVIPVVAVLGKTTVFKLLIAILIFIFAMILLFILRALIKRKRFINKLKKYCVDNSLNLSEISNAYSSIFRDKAGFNFTVEKNGKKYDCKFLHSLFPNSPLIMSDQGVGIKHTYISIRGIVIFSKKKDFTFSFESENKKILIILPIPKKILVSIRGTNLIEADTGEKLGEYTIHSANSFLNSLDRNCL